MPSIKDALLVALDDAYFYRLGEASDVHDPDLDAEDRVRAESHTDLTEHLQGSVVLVLTPEQAQALLDLTGSVGGVASTTRRGLIDGDDTSVSAKLLAAGVEYTYEDPDDSDLHGEIHFTPRQEA